MFRCVTEDVSVWAREGLGNSPACRLKNRRRPRFFFSHSPHDLTENKTLLHLSYTIELLSSLPFFVLPCNQRFVNHEVFYSPRCQHARLGYGRNSQDAVEEDAFD